MFFPHINFSLHLKKEGLRIFCIFLFIALNISAVYAQEAQVTEHSPIQETEQNIRIGEGSIAPDINQGVSFFTILRMVLALALAAAAIYGVVFFLKRISKPPEQKDPYLKVLAGVHLGANRFVHIVAVGSKAWLLGASEGGVSLISEIDDTETIDALLLEASKKSTETGKVHDFASILSRLTGGGSQTPDINADNVRKRRERLRGL